MTTTNKENTVLEETSNEDNIPQWYIDFKRDFIDNDNIEIMEFNNHTSYYHMIANKKPIKAIYGTIKSKTNLSTYWNFMGILKTDYDYKTDLGFNKYADYFFLDKTKTDINKGIYYGFIRKLSQFAKPNNHTNLNDFKEIELIKINDDKTSFNELIDNLYDNFNKKELEETMKVSIKIDAKVYYLDTFKPGARVFSRDFIDAVCEPAFWEIKKESNSLKNLEAFLKEDDIKNKDSYATTGLEEGYFDYYFQYYFYDEIEKKIDFKDNHLKRIFVKAFLLRLIFYYLTEIKTELTAKEGIELINHIINNYIQKNPDNDKQKIEEAKQKEQKEKVSNKL